MPSPFNAQAFMEQTVKAKLATRLPLIPEGEYIAQAKKIDFSTIEHQNINPPHGIGLQINITWEITDEEIKEATKLQHPTVSQKFLLDVLEPSKLHVGQVVLKTEEPFNSRLGAVLKACGLNSKTGWKLNQLLNQIAAVRVRHRTGDDGEIYSEVRSVGSIEEARIRAEARKAA